MTRSLSLTATLALALSVAAPSLADAQVRVRTSRPTTSVPVQTTRVQTTRARVPVQTTRVQTTRVTPIRVSPRPAVQLSPRVRVLRANTTLRRPTPAPTTVVQPATPEPAGDGQLRCMLQENGAPAAGQVTLLQNGTPVAEGACGTLLTAPAGTYTAEMTLTGAVDQPTVRRTVTVREGTTVSATASFSTAILEVRLEKNGERIPGKAEIRDASGRLVATIGSHVVARISTGTYRVTATVTPGYRHANGSRTFDGVRLVQGQRRALTARF